MNLSSISNKNVYYDEAKNLYFYWNNKKQTFEKAKHIKRVYKTGYIKTKKCEYLVPNGNMYIEKDIRAKIFDYYFK